MRKFLLYTCLFLFSIPGHPLRAQTARTEANLVKEARENLIRDMRQVSADLVVVNPIARYFETEVNNIFRSIRKDGSLGDEEKDKAVRSLLYFMKELGDGLVRRRINVYDVPAAVQSYVSVLYAVLMDKPLVPLLQTAGPARSQLMAASFSQFEQYPFLDDIAVYKRVASAPEFILQFLESKPDFRFADSLLLEVAAHDPMKLVYYVRQGRSTLRDRIRGSRNIYLQEIAALADDKQASELLPFLVPLSEKRITREEILEKRMETIAYFQLLVNTLHDAITSGYSGSRFLQPLRAGLKQKALAFYVNSINEQHSLPEAVRFASVKGLRPEDLYYVITTCGEELYTSSYLGLYKRLMQSYREGRSADSLFEQVHFDNFQPFIRLAANYNVLDDFLQTMPGDKARAVLRKFITGIEQDEGTGLDRAMDIADCFSAVRSDPMVSDWIDEELQFNLVQCKASQNYLGIRLYSILSDIFTEVRTEADLRRLWTKLGDYETLKRSALENDKGEIVEVVLFYGDEDGIISFSNFLRFYADKSKWETSKNGNWVSIRSVTDHPLVIYANRPLDIKDELDLKAQDSLFAFLKEQSLAPTVMVHRGHSYHLDKTLKRMTPSVRLAILGSCGGYNKSISIANINPDVQVIGSKKTGTMSINDPIINEINQTLLAGNDIYWPDLWKQLESRFAKDPTALGLFNEYFPPSHNLGLFVLKLFNYYKRFT